MGGLTNKQQFSVKMVGLFLVGLIGLSVIYDLWILLDIKRGLSMVSYKGNNSVSVCVCVRVCVKAIF